MFSISPPYRQNASSRSIGKSYANFPQNLVPQFEVTSQLTYGHGDYGLGKACIDRLTIWRPQCRPMVWQPSIRPHLLSRRAAGGAVASPWCAGPSTARRSPPFINCVRVAEPSKEALVGKEQNNSYHSWVRFVPPFRQTWRWARHSRNRCCGSGPRATRRKPGRSLR
jgi:hypothetical protein